ncbi:phosphate ABC transporter substrate-binding/OmpA family protein [Sulfitobacter sp.]|uniref:phosphate ABC transporter substrate-binding/OmpA family protein n=1 Tax=Sulfitobacter sp. TaxID=1903071 RepID=UPI003298411E
MRGIIRMLPLAGVLMAAMTPAYGQEVTLRSENDSVHLKGRLIEFDGTTFRLDTSIGVLELAAEGLTCEGEACPSIAPEKDFAAFGIDSLMRGVLPSLMATYAASNELGLETDGASLRFTNASGEEEAYVDVTTGSSAGAFAALIDGSASVGFTTRPASAEEMAKFQQAGVNALRESTLAVDGLAIVTPDGFALPSISVQNVARIFSGEIGNWSQIGGPDAAINLYARDEGSAVAEVFDTLVLEPSGQEMAANVTILTSDDEISKRVAADPFGIGFTRFAEDNAAHQLPIIGQCGLVVSPSDFNIRAEEYPLSYRLRAVTKANAQSEVLEGLMGFIATDAAQDVVAASGLTNQNLTRSPVDQQGMRFASALQSDKVIDAIPRLQNMVSEMVMSERLSATFRFEAGSRDLDERAQQDIARVAKLLNDETANGSAKTVRIMGFTDSLGNSELNQELSERRAQLVLDALLAKDATLADRVSFLPMGFGDVSPIGCDQSTVGRWINRRVEVWVSAATQ